MVTFTDLGVPGDIIDALDDRGIDDPFPIQAATIPPALEGRDICGRAPTGSGKTFAFGIPLVANVERARPKRPRALVRVPTRELAAQVSRDLELLGAGRGVRVHAFYGGAKFEPQVKALRRGVDIAVACPGRLVDLIDQGIVRLDGVDLVVVDEADRMADMGFLPVVRRLIDQTDPDRQTLLFSATLDGDVDELIRRYQHDPIVIDVEPPDEDVQVDHYFWSVPHADRVKRTAEVVQRVGPTVVFTRTRYGADRVATQLAREGVDAVAIHGNRTQGQRERALRSFRSGHALALVATDVAARGIHVDDVACVVHFDLPTDPKDYVHRSGRTGRAGATGVVVGFAMPDRRKDTNKLLRELDLDVRVTEPDVEALPHTPARTPRRTSSDGGSANRRPARPTTASGASGGKPSGHKSSGRRPKPKPDSPRDTRAGRAKSAADPQRSRDLGGETGSSRTTDRRRRDDGGPARYGRSEDQRSHGSKPGGQKSWGPKSGQSTAGSSRDERPRSGGSKSAGSNFGGSKPMGSKRGGSTSRGSTYSGPNSRGPKVAGSTSSNSASRGAGTPRSSGWHQDGGRSGNGGRPGANRSNGGPRGGRPSKPRGKSPSPGPRRSKSGPAGGRGRSST
ncbi:MAG: DEAD/DEAH box helicase [Actinobacteria bacterium]|nr:DEAD/DEAH box helicase [Actinomycetota bacterium]